VSKRLLGCLPEGVVWDELSDVDQIAFRVLDRQLMHRLYRRRPCFAAFTPEGGMAFTPRHIARLLRELRYPKQGIHFARHLRRRLLEMGAIEESEQRLLPRQQPKSHPEKTYYWKVNIVPAVAFLFREFRPLSAYDSGHCPSVPKDALSLSSELKGQGLIRKVRRTSDREPGSVQYTFAMSGPP